MKLKSAFLVSLFFLVNIAVAQANNLPITVTANESITVTLFFPSEIKKVIRPAVNYKFEYELHSTMGTLVARKGATSNLTVITKNGHIFSFLLQYDQEVDTFTYVLAAEQAIGRIDNTGITETSVVPVKKEAQDHSSKSTPEEGKDTSSQTMAVTEEQTNTLQISEDDALPDGLVANRTESGAVDSIDTSHTNDHAAQNSGNSLYHTDRDSYYEIFCENNYDQDIRMRKAPKAGDGVELQLNSLTADKNEFYFIFQMTNRLTSRFNADKLRFYVRTSRKDEPIEMTPIYVFNHPTEIDAGRTKKMVYVLEEFRLSKDQKVFVVLDELDGIRNTVLKIESQIVNAAGERLVSSAR